MCITNSQEKSLHTIKFQLYCILENTKLWRYKKISGCYELREENGWISKAQRIFAAAAAAKSLQSCPTLRPHRWQPNRFLRPWVSPGKNTGVGCHFLLQCMKVKSESEVAQSCPTLCDPMDCSLPGSSVHVIFQARVLEWVAIAFSINSSYYA